MGEREIIARAVCWTYVFMVGFVPWVFGVFAIVGVKW